MVDWHSNAIYYELYLRAFQDDNGDGHGDFAGLRQRLDYLEWLGVDVIWLLPMFPSPLRDDGYDVASYLGIHPDYGLLEDFILTLEEIHRRGMRLIIDMVLNHTSDQHPWFHEARRAKDSPLRDYYVWSPAPDRYEETRIIFLDTELSNWAYDGVSGEYYWHRFYSTQPDLNYDNPKVHEEMLRAMRFWLDLGVDGFRLDAVPYLYEREGTNCENLPETHAFLKDVRKWVDDNYPGRVLLAEANQWPQDLLPYFGDGDELHMCFHFPIMPRLFMALAQQDKTPIIDILAQTPTIPPGTQWATFLRNHDELTLEMVTEEDREFMWDFYAPEPAHRLNLGIRRRLAPLLDNDHRKITLMHSLLFTLPGAPVLYYGDEIGMGDLVSMPDRNGVRTPMQWSDELNGGFSSITPDLMYGPAITDPTYGYQTVNVESQRADPASLLHTIRKMIYARKRLSVLSDGALVWVDDTPRATLVFWRISEDRRSAVLALHNLSDDVHTIRLPEGMKFRAALDSEAELADYVTLAEYGFNWLVLESGSEDEIPTMLQTAVTQAVIATPGTQAAAAGAADATDTQTNPQANDATDAKPALPRPGTDAPAPTASAGIRSQSDE
ncbi:MAG: maltose alpha-D-glucosyltransferase [Chloroflexi bacterium]|nr:maltose alpha-D-glucosyltransferase [Chloroflexota bacterium]